jgi:starch phosphorylase
MDKYFGSYFPHLGINRKQFLSLGTIFNDDDDEPFKMPILAMKLSNYKNGVSKLHGQVSRQMWSCLWPGLPVNDVPITSVTNGIHTKSWLSNEMNQLYEKHFGTNWIDDTIDNTVWKDVDQLPDGELWRAHQHCKEHLVAFARERLKTQMERRGTYHSELNHAEEVLDPEALIIGFARRFASYKRGNLLLHDPERLIKLLSDPKRPVQIIFAGKAHPRDSGGKEIIRQIIHFAKQDDVRRRIVFIEDYDINIARLMIQGVDVWLNTPRRPMEASGTSGMKAAVNGALNISTLDGWWCEGYKPETGWIIGNGENYDDIAYQDVVESQMLYDLLENEIVPLFYTHSTDKLPRAWINKMKNSIRQIAPQFNTNRMVTDYTKRFYCDAAAKWQLLNTKDMENVRTFSKWKNNMKNNWSDLDIEDVQVLIDNGEEIDYKQSQLKVGSEMAVKALIKLGKIQAKDVSVELYHGLIDGWGNIRNGSVIQMNLKEPGPQEGCYWFEGTISCKVTGQYGMALRIMPSHPYMITPYELGLIHWETAEEKTPVSV